MAVTSPRIAQAGEQRSARVESLRALAALGVAFGHTFAIAVAFDGIFSSAKNRLLLSGGLGVFLFFTLTGYLLFLPFLRSQLGEGATIDLKTYARNRALRILPLYFAVVTTLLILQPFDTDRGDWWRFALFIENFSRDTVTRLDSPIWSLVVELHFYVALPLLAWLIARLARGSLARTALAIGLVAGASYAIREAIAIGENNNLGPVLGRYAMPTLLFMFAGGMLLAVARLAVERSRPRWLDGPLVGSSSAWFIAGAACFLSYVAPWTQPEALVALGGFLVVGGAILPLRPGPLTRALEWRPLALLGVASYSLYLWHVPLLERISGLHTIVGPHGVEVVGDPTDFKTLLAVSMPILIAVAGLSYAVIERPFLRLRRRWATTEA